MENPLNSHLPLVQILYILLQQGKKKRRKKMFCAHLYNAVWFIQEVKLDNWNVSNLSWHINWSTTLAIKLLAFFSVKHVNRI